MARILLAEDEPILNKLITRILEDAGHQVVSCGDGLEALGRIYSENFDLAVLDVVLPHIHGTRLLESFRKRQPKSMVILISGQAALDAALEAVRFGAYEFIKKPFRQDELLNVVDSALNESRLMGDSGYVYKDGRRQDKSLARNGFSYAISDSILAALAFFLAFLGQAVISEKLNLPFLLNTTELLQMSLSLGFCYAFVFVYKKCHRVDLIGNGRDLAKHIWRNISIAYVIFLAILFAGKDYHVASERMGVLFAYALGTVFLMANRYVLIANFMSLFAKEGGKNIIIVDPGKSAFDISRQIGRQSGSKRIIGFLDKNLALRDGPGANARLIASKDDVDRAVIADDVDELYISGEALSSADLIALLDKLRGRKLKIVMPGVQRESFQLADITSHIS